VICFINYAEKNSNEPDQCQASGVHDRGSATFAAQFRGILGFLERGILGSGLGPWGRPHPPGKVGSFICGDGMSFTGMSKANNLSSKHQCPIGYASIRRRRCYDNRRI